jgi:hypothetical protein
MDLGRVLWLAWPVIMGGAVHILVIRLNVAPTLAQMPIDGGLTWRGRRLLGGNKTWRGALVMIGATTLFTSVQAWMWHRYDWARSVSLVDFNEINPLRWGVLLGAGYVIGELPNSLLKRQLDVAPGARATGGLGPVFWLVDQLDSWLGVVVAMTMAWTPPFGVVAGLAILTLVMHPCMAGLMVVLGLKRRVG